MYSLIIPIIHINEFDVNEILVFFRLPHDCKVRHISMTPEEYERYVVKYMGVKPAPCELTRDERRQQIIDSITDDSKVNDDPVFLGTLPQWKDETRGVAAILPPETPDNMEEQDRINTEVSRLGLQPARVDYLKSIMKINEEAGPDGSDITLKDAASLVDLCFSDKVARDIQQQAFQKLSGLPMAKLLAIRKAMPRELAMHIAVLRVEGLGNDSHSIGRGYMPPSWSAFIEGDATLIDEMMRSAGIGITPHREPVENSNFLSQVRPEYLSPTKTVTQSAVEKRFAGMTFSGNQKLNE